ncbi:hypothetical protein SODALDRAFT_327174 [Sodiomyces alkalinus F11]|uniref:Uncharacterized protein n=1 Tax=Sodiomyces alkalinus (strain CBS 110278 / VKM F-3762 / F11) TaxID=1314773 RepID=A0A3N2Q8A4_SODAK|nr:hypothetical protein SODALDRAFT_327174 [Sodiomyces alkalinus F11]ROT43003.1 hypothetical protein SODALDRAFT_327174 [Sodiomyces alkalinus F11]
MTTDTIWQPGLTAAALGRRDRVHLPPSYRPPHPGGAGTARRPLLHPDHPLSLTSASPRKPYLRRQLDRPHPRGPTSVPHRRFHAPRGEGRRTCHGRQQGPAWK